MNEKVKLKKSHSVIYNLLKRFCLKLYSRPRKDYSIVYTDNEFLLCIKHGVIKRITGYSRPTIIKCLNDLHTLGYITKKIDGRGKCSLGGGYLVDTEKTISLKNVYK